MFLSTNNWNMKKHTPTTLFLVYLSYDPVLCSILLILTVVEGSNVASLQDGAPQQWGCDCSSSSALSGVSPAPSSSLSQGVWVSFSRGWIVTDAELPECIWAWWCACANGFPRSPRVISTVVESNLSKSSHTFVCITCQVRKSCLNNVKVFSETCWCMTCWM